VADGLAPVVPAGPAGDDLALTVARFGAALRDAGIPADPGRCERFARALAVARPARPRGVYLCALATLIANREHIEILQRVFAAMFGGLDGPPPGQGGEAQAGAGDSAAPREDALSAVSRLAKAHPGRLPPGPPAASEETGAEVTGHGATSQAGDGGEDGPEDGALAMRRSLASAAERLSGTDFAELSPAELMLLSGLMRKLTLAVPLRRSRRPRRTLHGGRTDLRATLRQARRTGGHPLRLAGRSPLLEPRRLVVLCDISGSMEPYARAMLQLLYCAAGGAQAEVFTFATRLTRLTGTLVHARPELALRRAGEAAPDWLGGTRIGEAIAQFNEEYGRRGMARGAVVVIISDGWDTGDPAVLAKAMERLSRVAHRIIWVNPRTQNPEYQPLAGGMAAAWPYCDAVVSAHSLHALDDLTAALAQPGHRRGSSRGAVRAHHWAQLQHRA
jgi:uncharacterized protein